MTHEEISALKEKEIAELNKYNDDNEYIDLFGCSGKLTINDFKLIKLIGKGSFGKVKLCIELFNKHLSNFFFLRYFWFQTKLELNFMQ